MTSQDAVNPIESLDTWTEFVEGKNKVEPAGHGRRGRLDSEVLGVQRQEGALCWPFPPSPPSLWKCGGQPLRRGSHLPPRHEADKRGLRF